MCFRDNLRILFTTKVGSENDKNTVQLLEYDSQSVESIVKYIYSGKINLCWQNVFEVMHLEELLQVWNLRSLLITYLRGVISKSNCWEIKAKADFYNYSSLSDFAFLFILENFKNLIREPEFLEVPYYILKQCLDSPVLDVPTEGVLLCNLISWVMHDFDARECYLEDCLSKVDPRQVVSWNDSVTVVTKLTEGTRAAPAIQSWLASAQLLRASYDGHITRRYKEVITDGVFAVGGHDVHGQPVACLEVTTNISVTPWRLLLPTTNSASPVSHHQDLELPPMPVPRYNIALASSLFTFYIIGGETNSGSVSRVDCYNVLTNSWSDCPPLPHPIRRASAAFFDSCIYVCGGVDAKSSTLKTLFVLRENGSKWMQLCSMEHGRHSHCLVAAEGALYALGGEGEDGRILNSMERYDPLTDTWLNAAPLLIPRKSFCGAAIEHSIVALRGQIDQDKPSYNERYSTRSNKWRLWKSSDICRPCYGGMLGRKLAVVSETSGHSIQVYSTVSETAYDGGPSLHSVRRSGAIASIKIPLYRKLPI